MNNLKEYIIEKFKITKNIKVNNFSSIERGEVLLHISLYPSFKNNKIIVRIGTDRSKTRLCNFIKFNKYFYFSYYDTDNIYEEEYYKWETKDNCKINKYGYFEFYYKASYKDDIDMLSIYLDKNGIINFLNDINMNINNITKNILAKYFENIDLIFDDDKLPDVSYNCLYEYGLKRIYDEVNNI